MLNYDKKYISEFLNGASLFSIIANKSMKRLYLILILIALIQGCTNNSALSRSTMDVEEVKVRMDNSPIVKLLTDSIYENVLSGEQISLYYKVFHALNRPDLVDNWRYYYTLGEGKLPKYEFLKIAEIEVYNSQMNDESSLALMRLKAAEIGGTGIVEIFKKPITDQRVGSSSGFFKQSFNIIGYIYFGVVIRKVNITNSTKE